MSNLACPSQKIASTQRFAEQAPFAAHIPGGKQSLARWALLLQAAAAAATALLLLFSAAIWQAGLKQPNLSRPVAHSDAAPQSLYVLRGSNASDGLLAAFQKLQQDLGADRTFLLFDDTRGPWRFGSAVRASSHRDPGSPNVVLFNKDEGVATMRGVADEMQYWDQPSLVLFYRHIESSIPFDYLWRLEGDVHCHGNWSRCLMPAAARPHDLLCASQPVHNVQGQPTWQFPRLGGALAAVSLQDRSGCFMPVLRLSQRAMQLVDQQMGVSSGYLEVFYPTLLDQAGMSMTGLPKEAVGLIDVQRNESADVMQRLLHKPRNNRLYHPVKI